MKTNINNQTFQTAKFAPADWTQIPTIKADYYKILKFLFKTNKEFNEKDLASIDKLKLLRQDSPEGKTLIYFGEVKEGKSPAQGDKANGHGMILEYETKELEKELKKRESRNNNGDKNSASKSYGLLINKRTFGVFEDGKTKKTKTIPDDIEKKPKEDKRIEESPRSQAGRSKIINLRNQEITLLEATKYFEKFYYAATPKLPMKMWLWSILSNSKDYQSIETELNNAEGSKEEKIKDIKEAIEFLEKAASETSEQELPAINYGTEISLTSSVGFYYFLKNPRIKLTGEDYNESTKNALTKKISFTAYYTISLKLDALKKAISSHNPVLKQ